MICRKQFRSHKLPISNLWEVQLDNCIWTRLRRCAYGRNCSFSWITRYCVFRIVRREHTKLSTAMEKLSSCVKNKYKAKPTMHRHILCLYGDDEKLLRMTAMELNITVSHLIRLALYKYLPLIEQKYFPWRYIFYYGTKLIRQVITIRVNRLKFPELYTIRFKKWSAKSWWKPPFGKIINIPYENESL